jgi:hypothetical protein
MSIENSKSRSEVALEILVRHIEAIVEYVFKTFKGSAEVATENEELNRKLKWSDEMGGPCSTNGENRNAYRLLVGKPEGKRPLERPRRRLVDNIKLDLGEVGWGDGDWIALAKDRNRWRALVNSVLNLRVP